MKFTEEVTKYQVDKIIKRINEKYKQRVEIVQDLVEGFKT